METSLRIKELIKDLYTVNDEMFDFGIKLAEAEREYRKALSMFLAEKILEGKKVTVLGDLARGDETVVDLRLERDKYKIMYETTQERIYAIKTEIRTLESEMKLDYNRRD